VIFPHLVVSCANGRQLTQSVNCRLVKEFRGQDTSVDVTCIKEKLANLRPIFAQKMTRCPECNDRESCFCARCRQRGKMFEPNFYVPRFRIDKGGSISSIVPEELRCERDLYRLVLQSSIVPVAERYPDRKEIGELVMLDEYPGYRVPSGTSLISKEIWKENMPVALKADSFSSKADQVQMRRNMCKRGFLHIADPILNEQLYIILLQYDEQYRDSVVSVASVSEDKHTVLFCVSSGMVRQCATKRLIGDGVTVQNATYRLQDKIHLKRYDFVAHQSNRIFFKIRIQKNIFCGMSSPEVCMTISQSCFNQQCRELLSKSSAVRGFVSRRVNDIPCGELWNRLQKVGPKPESKPESKSKF